MTDLCDLLGHGPADMGADPVPQSECLVCQIEAKDARIAELEAEVKQLHIVANHVQYEQLQDENERLRAVYEAVKNSYSTTTLDNMFVREAKVREAFAAAQEGEKDAS